MVKVLDAAPRPERLLSRIKINSVDENAPRLTVVRSPKGPDGTTGFHAASRLPRIIGIRIICWCKVMVLIHFQFQELFQNKFSEDVGRHEKTADLIKKTYITI